MIRKINSFYAVKRKLTFYIHTMYRLYMKYGFPREALLKQGSLPFSAELHSFMKFKEPLILSSSHLTSPSFLGLELLTGQKMQVFLSTDSEQTKTSSLQNYLKGQEIIEKRKCRVTLRKRNAFFFIDFLFMIYGPKLKSFSFRENQELSQLQREFHLEKNLDLFFHFPNLQIHLPKASRVFPWSKPSL